jgi:hypothetical protein
LETLCCEEELLDVDVHLFDSRQFSQRWATMRTFLVHRRRNVPQTPLELCPCDVLAHSLTCWFTMAAQGSHVSEWCCPESSATNARSSRVYMGLHKYIEEFGEQNQPGGSRLGLACINGSMSKPVSWLRPDHEAGLRKEVRAISEGSHPSSSTVATRRKKVKLPKVHQCGNVWIFPRLRPNHRAGFTKAS